MLNLSREKNRLRFSYVVLFFMSFLLSSCLTIESDMKINSNGSGSMVIKYKLDKGLKDISNFDSEDDIVPLNLSEEYLDEVTGTRDDVSYRGYRAYEDETYYNIEVTITFESIDGLNSILPDENRIVVQKSGSDTLFSQGIISRSDADVSEESLEIFKDIFKDHFFTLKINTPSDIKEVENGIEISDRVAVYQESFIDLISSNDKREWSVRW